MSRTIALFLFSVSLATAASCATTPRRAETANRRVKDSPAEKAAAHRAAAPRSLELEKDDERWSIEAARERKRAREEDEAARARPGQPTATTDVVEPSRPR